MLQLFDVCLAPNTLGDGTGCDNMTAVVVKFKFPEAETAENNAAAEVCVTEKRSKPEESNDHKTEENVIENPCKRTKTETAM